MKSLRLLTVLLLASPALFAQAYEGSVQYAKKKQASFIMEYNYPVEAVENAWKAYMERQGVKAKEEKGLFNKDKGFIVFSNALATEINEGRTDYVIRAEQKSRKESEVTVLYLLLLRNGSNIMAYLTRDQAKKVRGFLNEFGPELEAAHLEIQIRDQEEAVAKAEKKLASLKDDQVSLEKKLQDNKTEQENTQKDIEEQKQRLGQLQGKRKSL